MSEPDRRKWHLERSVSVTHIITTLSMIAAMFFWAHRTDTRITVLEVEQAGAVKSMQRIEGQLEKLNDKLDRLIER